MTFDELVAKVTDNVPATLGVHYEDVRVIVMATATALGYSVRATNAMEYAIDPPHPRRGQRRRK